MLSRRDYKKKDYNTLCHWLDAIEWPHIPEESVPNKCIFIIENGKEVAFTGLFTTEDSYDFLYPGWIVYNPDLPYKSLLSVTDYIAQTYEEVAKEHNKTHIMLTMQTASLVNYLCRKHNYHRAEKNVTRLIKYISDSEKEKGIFWYDQEGINEYFPKSIFADKS